MNDLDDDDLTPKPVTKPPAFATDIIENAWKMVGMDVYPPSDDTFLLLRTVKSFRDKISKPSIVLEVGSGSGSVITGVSRIFGANDCLYLAIDKNPKAAKCSKLMLKNEGVLKSDIIVTSLSSGMRLKGCVDVLLFNPPYVVTPDEEMEGDGISISWAGGKDGRIVIDQFLKCVPDLLSPKGVLFLVLIEENKPQEVIQILKNMYGLSGSVVAKERCGIEILYILLVRRAPS